MASDEVGPSASQVLLAFLMSQLQLLHEGSAKSNSLDL